ncbi:MAG: hypothetical protein LBK45_02570 [Tannerellaceae bacterium]|jgi:hypothetical protein|nr:hypothetical protein [Tannerellaceae bacterium]
MKRILLTLALLSCFGVSKAQQPITWQSLTDVTWKRAFVQSLGGYYDIASFGASLEALNNKEVSIKGFYVPIDMEGTVFALSKSPSSTCFFCGTGGIETVIEIVVKRGYQELKRIRIDKYIELKGTLALNRDDPEHLMYLLKDAELIQVIK